MSSFAVRAGPRAAECGRELALLAFAAGVTYLATQEITVSWSPAPCEQPGIGGLVAGVTLVPVAARRRLPVAALLAAAVVAGWYPAAGIALALASYTVSARIRRPGVRYTTLAVAALVPFAVGLVGSGFAGKTTAISFGVVALVCVAGPVLVEVLLGQRERLVGALRQQARFAASAARLEERSRIAQEMHDLLGHRLSLISLYAGSLELGATEPGEAEPLRLIRGTARTAMDELRTTLGMLRPAEPAETRPVDHTGTRADVGQLVRHAQAGGLAVGLTWQGDDLTGTAPPVRRAVHRIVREGLTNACRHAAGARTEVVIERGADRVRVCVTDDGGGSPGTAGSGLGLVGVEERVRLLGGTFAAGRRPGRGFRLVAELPLALSPPGAGHRGPEPDADDRPDRWARLGMAAVLATGLAGVVAILVVVFNTVLFGVPGAPPDPFDAVGPGTTRAQFTSVVGGDEPVARRAARGIEPALPEAADCAYSATFPQNGTTMIERFCFRSGLLVDKARFAVPRD